MEGEAARRNSTLVDRLHLEDLPLSFKFFENHEPRGASPVTIRTCARDSISLLLDVPSTQRRMERASGLSTALLSVCLASTSHSCGRSGMEEKRWPPLVSARPMVILSAAAASSPLLGGHPREHSSRSFAFRKGIPSYKPRRSRIASGRVAPSTACRV